MYTQIFEYEYHTQKMMGIEYGYGYWYLPIPVLNTQFFWVQLYVRNCDQVREALMIFVQNNFGANHTKRGEWLSHNTRQAKELFLKEDDQLLLLPDGTYCYIQKSANSSFKRHTYSGKKKDILSNHFLFAQLMVHLWRFMALTAQQ